MKPRVFLPAIVTGPLLWAAFFPLNLGPIAFFALAPWLALVRAPVSGKRLYFAGYLGGLAFFLPALQWVRVAHPAMYASWFGLALVCPLFWVAALFLLRRVDQLKLVPLSISVPIVWVALEYVRAHFPTGFPFLQHVGLYQMIGFGWYFLGYTQHEFTALTQIAELGGVYAVSFVVAMVNGAVAEWVLRSPAVLRWLHWNESPRVAWLPAWTGSAAVVAMSVIGFGSSLLDHAPFESGPKVAAIQASVGQSDKMEDLGGLVTRYNRLCVQASRDADLVVWPETCYPFGWFTVDPKVPPSQVPPKIAETVEKHEMIVRKFATGQHSLTTLVNHPELVMPPWRSPVLLGLNGYEWDGSREVPTNTALFVDAQGNPLGRYDKMHLVIFGEYVPFRETMPWLQAFTPYSHDYSCRPGGKWTRFLLECSDGRSFFFGCLICYEDSDPYMARQYALPEPGKSAGEANFLVNISNDGWFDGTEEHEQHLAICRFRAIEARRSIVRAVNMGISAVIDPDGRVIALPGDSWSTSKKMDGIVSANVPIDHRVSLYSRLGDWLPAGCWLLLTLGHFLAVYRRRTAPADKVSA